MSEADPTEVSLVSTRDGVRVEKTFEPEDFPVPAIAFAITSERDEPVEVRIADGVPDPVDPQDIGFHPKYGAEFWSVEGDQIVFERTFDPGEEYTTVYGLRSESDGVEQYLSEPTIDRVETPSADAEETIDLADPDGGSDGDGQDAAEGQEGSTDDGSEDEGGPAGPEGPSGPSLPDDVGAGDQASEEGSAGTEAAVTPLAEGDLAAALAAELRDGEVDDETVETLREALDVEGRRSVEARIDRVQSDVADLRAYRDALEEFLDENGDAQQLLERVEEQTEELSENVATLRAEADERDDRIDELEGELSTLEEELSTLDEEIETLASDVDALEETVDDVEADVDDLRDIEAQLDDVRDDIEALSEMRDRLSSVFGAGAGGGGGDGGADGDGEDGDDGDDGS